MGAVAADRDRLAGGIGLGLAAVEAVGGRQEGRQVVGVGRGERHAHGSGIPAGRALRSGRRGDRRGGGGRRRGRIRDREGQDVGRLGVAGLVDAVIEQVMRLDGVTVNGPVYCCTLAELSRL